MKKRSIPVIKTFKFLGGNETHTSFSIEKSEMNSIFTIIPATLKTLIESITTDTKSQRTTFTFKCPVDTYFNELNI